MNQVKLWTAIKARLDGDTGAGGLFEDDGANAVVGVYNTIAPTARTEDQRYIVFNVAAADQRDGFGIDVVEYTIYLSLFYPVHQGLAVGSAILDRIYGNGVTQAGRVPTYGLHRWQPTLSGTSWVASVMYRIDQATNHSEDVYNFIETYRVTCSLKP